MTILQVEHRISSYDEWKHAFDKDPIDRKRSGVKRYQIYTPVDDLNYVIVDLYFDKAYEAKTTLNALQNLWSKVEGTVLSNPKARILHLEEDAAL